MAPTGKVEPQFGWQNQAEQLALTHTPTGVAAMTLAKKTRGRSFATADLSYAPDRAPGIEPHSLPGQAARETTLPAARELQTQLARQKLVGRQMRDSIEALSQRAEDAEKRYADLEDELNVAREEILLQQNDKHSLQTSLDSLAGENAQLTARLAESNAALEQARNQLQHGNASLNVAKLAHNSLSAALEEGNRRQRAADSKLDAATLEYRNLTAAFNALQRKYQTEANDLKVAKLERNKLFAAIDRADQKNQAQNQKLKALQVEHDRLAIALDETNKKSRSDIEELKSSLEAATSRAVIAENLVAKVREILLEKFALLQTSLETRNCELTDLERSRTRLIDGTKMLLEIFAMRDIALARADARIRFLTDRIAELEAAAHQSRPWRGVELVSGVHGRFLDQASPSVAVEVNSDENSTDGTGIPESLPPYLASTMLAATVTF
jgi:predicted  nucleic acid-binding Zn-ribbon protein